MLYKHSGSGIKTTDLLSFRTFNTKENERNNKEAVIQKLFLERMSQRGIARVVGVSRKTVANYLKKRFA